MKGMSKEEKRKQDRKDAAAEDRRFVEYIRLGGKAVLAVSFAWILIALLFSNNKAAQQAWAQMGDSFGTLNSLFSAGAVIMALYAIHLQRIESRLQREANEDNLAEHEATTEAQELIARIQVLTNLVEIAKYEATSSREKLDELTEFVEKNHFLVNSKGCSNLNILRSWSFFRDAVGEGYSNESLWSMRATSLGLLAPDDNLSSVTVGEFTCRYDNRRKSCNEDAITAAKNLEDLKIELNDINSTSTEWFQSKLFDY